MVVVGCILVLLGVRLVWQRTWFARMSIDWRVEGLRASSLEDPERIDAMAESLRTPDSLRLQVLITLGAAWC